MGLSFNPQPFDLLSGLTQWLLIVGIVSVIALIASLVMSFAAIGPTGPLHVAAQIRDGVIDLFGTSARRVWALTVLTFREAFRRKTLFVFGVFALLFLFAGWFMSDVTVRADLQVKNYVSFVLRTISWLILPVVLLLACWGVPEDIKARSLHTVVTKPVRRHEIVLGRILGYTLIGLVVLGVMGAVGYFWIVRQLPSRMREQLVARVPIYGDVVFLDNTGMATAAGINVGDENMFRSFIEGNTKARAIWEFENVTPARLGSDGNLVLESSFQSFRVVKGNLERGVLAQFTLSNATNGLRVPLKPMEVKEFQRNSYDVREQNPTLIDENGKTVQLTDLLQDGKLRVEVACLSGSQFLGMARPDLFLRMPDRTFEASYFKSIASIGLMMFMVVTLGVAAGCFAKGPVATIMAGFIFVVGRVAHSFLQELVTGRYRDNPNLEVPGRGIMDSFIRIPTHQAPTIDLIESPLTRIAKMIDNWELSGLWAVQHLFPDFGMFDTTEYVANAFDVPWRESLLPNLAVAIGYSLPWIVVGYFSLKVRELEAK
ncbi:MAG: ABC transporter permease [Planctomycetaceae bacterium]